MSKVKIEGLAATTLLAAGETAVVEHTELIDRLAARGWIRIHGSVADASDARGDEATRSEPPRSGKGSTRDAWAAHLDTHGIARDDQATKADLIAAWDQEQAR